MEQGLVSLNVSTAIPSVSTTTSVSTNESTYEQQRQTDGSTSPVVMVVQSDGVMDLLRAIEMSRLQAVRENEQNIYRPNTKSYSNSTINTNEKIDYFNDLQQAIELSLRIKGEQQLKRETTGLF